MTNNPYVGPRHFEQKEEQYFFGRREETEILTSLVMARRATLFFAQSGAGKSSLIRAGLIPELTGQEKIRRGRRAAAYPKMRVLPIASVGIGAPGEMNQSTANVLSLAPCFHSFRVSPLGNWAALLWKMD